MRIMRAGLAALFPLLLAACEDEFSQDWTAIPDTVELFSLTRPELIGRASAFDFVWENRVAAETWGRAGRARYESLNLSWANVIQKLLA